MFKVCTLFFQLDINFLGEEILPSFIPIACGKCLLYLIVSAWLTEREVHGLHGAVVTSEL